jgi:centromere protein C
MQSSLLSSRRDKPATRPASGRKRAFDLSMHSDDEDEEISRSVEGDSVERYASLEDASGMNGDLSQGLAEDSTHESTTITKVKSPQKARGSRKGATDKLASPFASSAGDKASMDPPAAKRRTRHSLQEDIFDIEPSESADTAKTNGNLPTNKGRKKRSAKIAEEAGPSKPAKRPRSAVAEAATPASSARKGPKPPPSERNPNARITAAKGKDKVSTYKGKEKATAQGKENAPTKEKERAASVELTETRIKPSGPKSKPRGLYVLRSETPAEHDGTNVLRSGRVSVKPVAYWRGERVIYGESKIEGKNLVLPAIKEVVRTEEVVESRPKRSNYRSRTAAVRRGQYQDVEESDEDREEWELDPGFLRAEVTKWNPDDQDNEEVTEEIGRICT